RRPALVPRARRRGVQAVHERGLGPLARGVPEGRAAAAPRTLAQKQLPAVPAVQASGQLGHFGPGGLPFSVRKVTRSGAPTSKATRASIRNAGHGCVPAVPEVSPVWFLANEARSWARSCEFTRTPLVPGNFPSHRLP